MNEAIALSRIGTRLLNDLHGIDDNATHGENTYEQKMEKILEAFDWVYELAAKQYRPVKPDAVVDHTEVET